MSLRTALVIDGDSDGAQRAVADVEKSMALAETEAQALDTAYDRLEATTRSLEAATDQSVSALNSAKAAFAAGEIGLEEYNKSLLETKQALSLVEAEHNDAMAAAKRAEAANASTAQSMGALTKVSGAQRAGMQQLSYQLNDVATMYALGARPMQIFASQSGQVFQATQMLLGGTSKFAAFLGGPWGIAITSAVSVLAVLGGQLLATGDDAETAAGKIDGLTDSLKRLAEEQGTIVDIARAEQKINALRERQLQIDTEQSGHAGRAARKRHASIQDEIDLLEQQVVWNEVANEGRKKSNETAGNSARASGKATAATKKHTSALADKTAATEREIAQTIGLAAAYGEGAAAALAFGKSEQELRLAIAETTAAGAKRIADLEAETSARAILNNQVAQGLITAEEAAEQLQLEMDLRPALAAAALAEGDAKARLTAIIQRQRDAYADNNAEIARGQSAAQTAHIRTQTGLIRQEIGLTRELGERRIAALTGLNGQALEEELAAINVQREKSTVRLQADADAEELRKQKVDGTSYAAEQLNAQLEAQIEAIYERADAEEKLIDLKARFDAEARAAARLAQQVAALAGTLGNLGGVGGQIGGLIGALGSGDPASALLGMGGFGSAAGLLLNPGSVTRLGFGIEGGLNQLGIGNLIGGSATQFLGQGLAGAGVGGLAGGLTGSSTGGSIAGLAGAAIGLGPLGIIGAGLLGGVLGGALKSTKRGSAIVGGAGDNLSVTGFYGNSQSRKDTASAIADDAIRALEQIASLLGGTLDASQGRASVGQREGEFFVDPQGRGYTKQSKFPDILGFGQDQVGARDGLIADLISDGVVTGLSGTLENILSGDGSLDERLGRARTVQGIGTALEQARDPQGYALKLHEEWRAGIEAVLVEAGAGADELAQLEELAAIRRKEIVAQFGSDVSQLEQDFRDKNIELLAAEGKAYEAQMAARAAELEDAPEHLKATIARIHAAQDGQLLRQAEIALLVAQGDELGALTLQRDLERAAMSPAVAAIHARIWALENEAKAEAAAAASRERSQQWFLSRQAIMADILTLEGDTIGALTITRANELRAAEASLRPLLQRKYALENEARAASQAAEAAAELAQKQKAIADERYSLEDRYLNLIGDKAALRDRELERTDPENREYLQMIFEVEDALARQEEAARAAAAAQEAAARAAEAHGRAIEQARSALADAWQRERGELEQTRDTFRALAGDIREFRTGLSFGAPGNPAAGFGQAQAEFQRTARLAQFGNENSLKAFQGDAQDYLDAALSRSASLLDYQRTVAEVANAARRAESGAGGVASAAERQAAALDAQVAGLIDIDENVLSVREAIEQLNALQTDTVVPAFTHAVEDSFETVRAELQTGREETKAVQAETKSEVARVTELLGELLRIFRAVTYRDYLRVGVPSDKTLPVTISGTIDTNITNNTGSPVPVDQVS